MEPTPASTVKETTVQASPTTPKPSFAPSRSMRWAILTGLLLTLVGCDQATKQYAVNHWKNGPPPAPMLGGILQIQYAENHGAFLSLLANLPPEARFWMLTVGNSLALLWLAGFLLTHPKLERIPFCALTCVLCGGIGNLIDRVCLDGIVIDFLNVGVMLGKVPLRTGIFNVADMAITGGAMLLVPWMFKSPQDEGLGSGAAIKS